MAALQHRGDSCRLIFQYLGQQHSCTLGNISETEAYQCKTRCEQLLLRVKQGLLEVPPVSPSPTSFYLMVSLR
jgi:hypothetical protein